MFVLMDILPVLEDTTNRTDYYMKYMFAEILLSALCYNRVRFGKTVRKQLGQNYEQSVQNDEQGEQKE